MSPKSSMKVVKLIGLLPCFFGGLPCDVLATTPASVLLLTELIVRCAPDIHPQTLSGIIATESTFNPYAIGIVNGKLRQLPRTNAEAIATAKQLEKLGLNFSMGLAQVNRHNLNKVGETFDTIFEPCRNIKAAGIILKDCYARAINAISDKQQALRAALSCYYSGNFIRGFKSERAGGVSYVQKVVAYALDEKLDRVVVPAIEAQLSDDSVQQLKSPSSEVEAGNVKLTKIAPAWGIYEEEPVSTKTQELPPVKVKRLTERPMSTPPNVDLADEWTSYFTEEED